MSDLEHHFVETNGVRLHVVTSGPKNGRPVILLHGFPEFWHGWINQIDFLAQQGFRVIVPDQRGYNLSDKPKGRQHYHIDKLVGDILGLMDAFGYARVCLAGHDWGAVVAWWLATRHPERLEKLAILNVPYPTLLTDALRERNWSQIRKSWYIGFFQLPWVPELIFRLSNRTDKRNMLAFSGFPKGDEAATLEPYRQAWGQPGAVTGMINWYRAAIGEFLGTATPEKGSLPVPTLILWGEQDVALDKSLVAPSRDLCAEAELHFFPNATHWVQHDEAEAVNGKIGRFFML